MACSMSCMAINLPWTRSLRIKRFRPSASSAPRLSRSMYIRRARRRVSACRRWVGAKNHMIVMPDADMDQAADALVGAAYGSAGERCMAISVAVAVGAQTADALLGRLEERIGKLKIGDGAQDRPGSAVDVGPLVTKTHLEKVSGYLATGQSEGAELVVDGRKAALPHGDGFFLGACLFDHVKPEMTIYREEIFGPVLGIVRTSNFETALALINEHEYGNGTSIFTRDGDTARDFCASRAGRHGGDQRTDTGAHGVPQLWRLEALVVWGTTVSTGRRGSASTPGSRRSRVGGRLVFGRGWTPPCPPSASLHRGWAWVAWEDGRRAWGAGRATAW